jgi:hypothetical protein
MLHRSLAVALLATIGLSPAAQAAPTLVEFRWSDASGSLIESTDLGDDVLSPRDSKDKSPQSNGKSANAHAKNEARALSLWISRDGINWKRAELEIMSWSETGATGRVKSVEGELWDDLAGTTNEWESISDAPYVGLSSSTETWSGEFSARLVSVQLSSLRSIGAVPEPGTLALFGLGLGALGLTLRFRRRP